MPANQLHTISLARISSKKKNVNKYLNKSNKEEISLIFINLIKFFNIKIPMNKKISYFTYC